MKFWDREPRAVYRVYDEDDYLAGPDMHDGEQDSVGQESQDPAGGFGHIDAGYSNHSAAVPDAHVREPRDVFTVRPHRSRRGRVLALGLLCVVAASAAALVGLEISRRSGSARGPVHSAPARPLRSVVGGSNVPISKTSTSSVSASSAFSSPSPDSRAAVAPAEHARPARLAAVPARRDGALVLPTGRPARLADVAERYAAGSSPAPEAQVDREFGFER